MQRPYKEIVKVINYIEKKISELNNDQMKFLLNKIYNKYGGEYLNWYYYIQYYKKLY